MHEFTRHLQILIKTFRIKEMKMPITKVTQPKKRINIEENNHHLETNTDNAPTSC